MMLCSLAFYLCNDSLAGDAISALCGLVSMSTDAPTYRVLAEDLFSRELREWAGTKESIASIITSWHESFYRDAICVGIHIPERDVPVFSLVMRTSTMNHRPGEKVVFSDFPREYEQRIESIFRETVASLPIMYGYCKVIARARHSTTRHHSPEQGPSQLEWLNFFGSAYEAVFRPEALRTVPIDVIQNPLGQGFLLRVGSSAHKFYGLSSRWKAHKYRRSLGKDSFSHEAYWPWWAALLGMLYIRRAVPAKRLPRCSQVQTGENA